MTWPVSACDSVLRLTLEPSSNWSIAGSRDCTTYLPAASNTTATGCPASVLSVAATGVSDEIPFSIVPKKNGFTSSHGDSHRLAFERGWPDGKPEPLGFDGESMSSSAIAATREPFTSNAISSGPAPGIMLETKVMGGAPGSVPDAPAAPLPALRDGEGLSTSTRVMNRLTKPPPHENPYPPVPG